MKGQGPWRSLARAVDKHGQTMDLLLTEPRDTAAARRLLKQASRRHGLPETLPLDGSAARPPRAHERQRGTRPPYQPPAEARLPHRCGAGASRRAACDTAHGGGQSVRRRPGPPWGDRNSCP